MSGDSARAGVQSSPDDPALCPTKGRPVPFPDKRPAPALPSPAPAPPAPADWSWQKAGAPRQALLTPKSHAK
ncbi:MAG: hypothetical protein DYG89_20410 [Caldilinea sp. CFX5]|nr:hypothetical protein [Caldilinea sp. CFX5]